MGRAQWQVLNVLWRREKRKKKKKHCSVSNPLFYYCNIFFLLVWRYPKLIWKTKYFIMNIISFFLVENISNLLKEKIKLKTETKKFIAQLVDKPEKKMRTTKNSLPIVRFLTFRINYWWNTKKKITFEILLFDVAINAVL